MSYHHRISVCAFLTIINCFIGKNVDCEDLYYAMTKFIDGNKQIKDHEYLL